MSTSFDTAVVPDQPQDVSEIAEAATVPAIEPTIERRHDLDALRAIAMLLGIVLHAALSFSPIPWTVKDSQTSEFYSVLFAVVHGFRMPLFFMLSGFFTAMLWRKRGLGGLIKQRLKRIALPLFLGCLTIVPSMWAVSSFVSRPSPAGSQNVVVWEAVVAGDTDRVRTALENDEVGVDAVSQDGASLLTVAVFLGHAEMVQTVLGIIGTCPLFANLSSTRTLKWNKALAVDIQLVVDFHGTAFQGIFGSFTTLGPAIDCPG